MGVVRFEDLNVWQESMNLAAEVYGQFRSLRVFSLREQALKSAISIPSNIAEGFERRSNKEFIQHLYVAKGSCGELRTQLHLCERMELIDKGSTATLVERTKRISAMLMKLIKTRSEKF